MVDRYIAIATPRFADFRPFVCDPQEEDSRDADPTRGGNGLRGDNLPVFLEGALTGATTRGGGEKAAAAPAWGIHWIDLELVLPARFDELTRTKTSKPESMSKGALKR